MAENTGIVAVVDSSHESTGTITLWHLSGQVTHAALSDAWRDAGLDEELLPSVVTPKRALSRAVNDLKGPRRLIRPLLNHAGFAVVDEMAVEGDQEKLDHVQTCTVKLSAETGRPTVEPAGHLLVHSIEHAFDAHMAGLSQTDISVWLTDLAKKLKAVALRESGGIYFIPRPNVQAWKQMIGALREASSHVVIEIPAMRSDEAVEAILDSVMREVESEVVHVEDELSEGSLGSRGITSRVAHASVVEEKVAFYEDLLGTRLDSLRERLAQLQANLAGAALKASLAEVAA